jgi:hypothetical protein
MAHMAGCEHRAQPSLPQELQDCWRQHIPQKPTLPLAEAFQIAMPRRRSDGMVRYQLASSEHTVYNQMVCVCLKCASNCAL